MTNLVRLPADRGGGRCDAAFRLRAEIWSRGGPVTSHRSLSRLAATFNLARNA